MRRMLAGICVLLIGAVAQASSFSPERLQRVDQFVERAIEAGEIAGAVTLVAQNGRIVHLKAHGFMDKASRKPMRTDTLFRIASMTKPVAGVALMMMIEEGKVRLNDPVSRFLPSFRNQMVAVPRDGGDYYTVPADREITVFDLLTHTSGLMSGPIGNAAGGKAYESRLTVGLKWVDELGKTPLEFQPGSRWAYSPFAGFNVVARIVEIASGQDFNTFTRERIFKPLGMKETFYWPTDEQRARLATVYERPGGKGELQVLANPDSGSSPVYFSGSGGLMTTAENYARFAMMLANGGELNGTRILGERSVEMLRSAHIPDTLPGRRPGESFGLSVRVVTNPAARRTMISEGSFGWSGAYGTHFWVDPKEKIVAIFMTQRWGFSPSSDFPSVDFETAVMQALVD
ncbi:MAG TPA: serine hydrolase domain-containing protein [Steroidobacteraceae bacterium]